MARNFALNGDKVQSTTFQVTSAGTVSLLINPNFNSGDNNAHCFCGFGGGGGGGSGDTPSFQKYSDNNIYAGFNDVGGGDQRIVISDAGLFTAGTWANWVFTWSAAAGQELYKNAVSKGTHALTVPTIPAQVSCGNYDNASNSNNSSANSIIAEFAIWDAILSAGEIGALAKNYSPAFIRPANLLLYWPIIGRASPEVDPIGGFAGTVAGPGSAVAAHPRIIMPRKSKTPWIPAETVTI